MRKRNFFRFLENTNGVAAVEFVLIAPILLLLLIGLVDFGLYINAKMKLENMARASSEYVRNGGDPNNLTADVLAYSGSSDSANSFDDITLTTSNVCECDDNVETDCATGCAADGYMREFIIINLDMTYNTLFPYPGLPGSIPLSGRARMQIQ